MSIQKQKDNIKRYEIKFVFTNKDENKLLKNNKLKKIFPDRIVESIYFDTSEFKFFITLWQGNECSSSSP